MSAPSASKIGKQHTLRVWPCHTLILMSPGVELSFSEESWNQTGHQPCSDITSLPNGTVWMAQCKDWNWIPVQPRAGARSCLCLALSSGSWWTAHTLGSSWLHYQLIQNLLLHNIFLLLLSSLIIISTYLFLIITWKNWIRGCLASKGCVGVSTLHQEKRERLPKLAKTNKAIVRRELIP